MCMSFVYMCVCALCACLVLVESRLLSLIISLYAGIAGVFQYAPFYAVLGIKPGTLYMLGTLSPKSDVSQANTSFLVILAILSSHTLLFFVISIC